MPQRPNLLKRLSSDLENLYAEIMKADTAKRVAPNLKADRVVRGLLNCLYRWKLQKLN